MATDMSLSTQNKRRTALDRVRELCVFAMLGTLMFCSKIVMELLPNLHILGTLVMVYTVVYRVKALVPVYVFVFIAGLYAGFAPWWVPYLYIWLPLWGLTMILPRKMPTVVACAVYPIVCSLHGFAYGILYAPAQAIMFGLDFKGMVAWVIAGFYFDLIHGFGNIVMGMLVYPLSKVLGKIAKRSR